jgi:hypothetical protein
MPTHREVFYRKYNIPLSKSLSIEEIADIAKVPVEALKEISNRAGGAWGHNLASVRLKSNYSKNPDTYHFRRASRLSKSQWEFARIYSFLTRGKAYYTADKDIAIKYKI